ncbi:MAG: squalene/phytoene synthase family protein [Chloroflexi bacterium]|nr:squalene/phytoene synthase family protein [Chloroflexota bacterium]
MIILSPQTWESRLLSLAYEGYGSVNVSAIRPIADSLSLYRAYTSCAEITATHSKTFHAATSLLPREKRRAVRALYAFCRVADNIVDCCDCDAKKSLATWRKRALSSQPPANDPIAIAWTDTRLRYRIPTRYAEQLIDGVARDLHQTRYQTFDELTAYAYGVASTVGLMSMHIIGYASADAIPFAIKLGVALQLTNILRDVGEDWRAGRLYLPQKELAAFDLKETDIENGCIDERWRAYMRFQIARNRQLYAEAIPGIKMLNKDGRFAVMAAAELYRAILDDIETHDYDVFNRRAHVSTARKLSKLPKIWWHSR